MDYSILAQVAEEISIVSGWWVPIVVTAGLAIVGVGVNILRTYVNRLLVKWEATDAEKERTMLLMEGIVEANDELVTHLKLAAADGKLTQGEMKQAKDIALNHAIKLGKEQGLDLVKEVGIKRLGALIELLLAKIK